MDTTSVLRRIQTAKQNGFEVVFNDSKRMILFLKDGKIISGMILSAKIYTAIRQYRAPKITTGTSQIEQGCSISGLPYHKQKFPDRER